jgi:4-hydroxythreonine-4-phosphate dehydrogenase
MSLGKLMKIGITQGDTNGIGYEVIMGALEDSKVLELFTPIIYGSKKSFSEHKQKLEKTEFNVLNIKNINEAKSGKINLLEIQDGIDQVEFGKATPAAGKAAYVSLEKALNDLKNGLIDALVTAPINKDNIQSENFRFPGHTEYLAEKDGKEALMFMISEKVKIAVVTGHIPVGEIAQKINQESIVKKLHLINQSLQKDFNIRKPKIAILGLNPHASDNGLIGKEDLEIVSPAIEKAKSENIFCFGPYPADGFFGNAQYHNFDAILAMYHDQGLIPFKTLAFGEGTNYTAGLSFVRTSPDHGTGYDIAGKGIADSSSMLRAIFWAVDICRSRNIEKGLEENKLDPNLVKNFYKTQKVRE